MLIEGRCNLVGAERNHKWTEKGVAGMGDANISMAAGVVGVKRKGLQAHWMLNENAGTVESKSGNTTLWFLREMEGARLWVVR